MPVTITPVEQGAARIELDGPLTIMQALQTRGQLASALAGAARAEVGLGGVTEVDCAGLQLLLAMKRGQVPVEFGPVSEPLRAVLEYLNLLPQLGLEP